MTFKKKLFAGVGAALAILIAAGAIGYRAMVRNNTDMQHVVIESLENVQANAVTAESAERGYIITGQEWYVSPYQEALSNAQKSMADLRQLTTDNPIQQRNLDRLEPLVDARFGVLESVVDLRKRAGLDAAAAAVRQGTGRVAMTEIHKTIEDMEQEERSLLATRTKEADASTSRAERMMLGGSSLGFVFLFFAGALI